MKSLSCLRPVYYKMFSRYSVRRAVGNRYNYVSVFLAAHYYRYRYYCVCQLKYRKIKEKYQFKNDYNCILHFQTSKLANLQKKQQRQTNTMDVL